MTMPDMNFACRGCGRCCDSAPQMSVREGLRLADVFPVMVCFKVYSKRTGNQIGDLVTGRMAEFGAMPANLNTRSGYQNVVLGVSASPFRADLTRKCPMLRTDGRCGIYERRPNACRYVPMQHLLPEDRQQPSFAAFVEEHGDNCDWSAAAPPLLRDGRIVNPQMKAGIAAAVAEEHDDARLMRVLYEHGRVLLPDGPVSASGMIEAAAEGDGECWAPMSVLLAMLHGLARRGLLPEGYELPELKPFVAMQIACAERAIAANMARKNKDERRMTEGLKALIVFARQVGEAT